MNNKLTHPEQFVPGMLVTLHHEEYGDADYIVESVPYTVESWGTTEWKVYLRHVHAKNAVKHSLNELGVTHQSNTSWVTATERKD